MRRAGLFTGAQFFPAGAFSELRGGVETGFVSADVSLNESKTSPAGEPTRLRDLSPQQWKSGLAAWLGWTFDGLDMHLYTLVAAPFVAQLIAAPATTDPMVGRYSSIIQAAFLLGWALGGGFFGRLGDRIGRARALSLTVLTYAAFTGLSFFAQTWWQLMIFRFLSALGIGGEWAVGASLLSETWPKKWRPWVAAVLQSGVNVGILTACLANFVLASAPPRYLFLVGALPAVLVFYIRRAVPETDVWREAKKQAAKHEPGIGDLFRGKVRRTTLLVMVVCAVSLTAHWAFLFWHQQHLRNLPDVLDWTAQAKNKLASQALYLVIAASIVGNFFAAWLARLLGYRRTIAAMSFGYMLALLGAFGVARGHREVLFWLPVIGFFQGLFALYTMYLPPLFPTLLRTTGAGFCYNIGRVFAAAGTVLFGLVWKSKTGDYRLALMATGFLFLPAAIMAFFLPHSGEAESEQSKQA